MRSTRTTSAPMSASSIAQNGPGITNFVTATAAAYWAHSPVVVITPETGSMTLGLGGFQETEQLPIFSKITKFQSHVNNKLRMAELTARAFDRAHIELGPTQLNIPRDFFYGDGEYEIPSPIVVERGVGGEKALDDAAELLIYRAAWLCDLGRPYGPEAAMAVLEELEETARLWLLTQGRCAALDDARIDELRQAFGARW